MSSSSPPPPSPPAAPVVPMREYFLGGLSSVLACLFSNPFEVVKTRMQLQGELQAANNYQKTYRNAPHAFVSILRNEGLRGIQRGLIPALAYQVTMNGTRLGAFDPIKRALSKLDLQLFPIQPQRLGTSDPSEAPVSARRTFLRNLISGAAAGAIGASIGSPLFLVKTRIQTQTSVSGVSFGHQHNYKGVIDGFRSIYRQEGFWGFFRGVNGAVPRVMVGSATQLTSYDYIKTRTMELTGWGNSFPTHFVSSFGAGFLVMVCMNPFDVVSTRLYNQKVVDGKGASYSGLIDGFIRIGKSEGLKGFYKGATAHYFRIAPHTILTFLFWEQLKKLSVKWDERSAPPASIPEEIVENDAS